MSQIEGDHGPIGGSSGGAAWGDLTGTLSDQTDLQTALDGKVNDTGNETIAGAKTFSDTLTASGNVAVGNALGVSGSYYIGALTAGPIMDQGAGDQIRFRASDASNPAAHVGVKSAVEAKTSAYPVLVLDSNKTFTNEGTTGRVDFTLPAAAAGLRYQFYVADTDGIRVIAVGDDTIRNGGSVTGAAGRVDNAVIGSIMEIIAINATSWIVKPYVGTWTVT